jgi:hypothetical protein
MHMVSHDSRFIDVDALTTILLLFKYELTIINYVSLTTYSTDNVTSYVGSMYL